MPRAEPELALGPVSWGFHLSELPLSQLGGRDSHTHFAREPWGFNAIMFVKQPWQHLLMVQTPSWLASVAVVMVFPSCPGWLRFPLHVKALRFGGGWACVQLSASAVHGNSCEPGAQVLGAAEQSGVRSGIYHAGG